MNTTEEKTNLGKFYDIMSIQLESLTYETRGKVIQAAYELSRDEFRAGMKTAEDIYKKDK